MKLYLTPDVRKFKCRRYFIVLCAKKLSMFSQETDWETNSSKGVNKLNKFPFVFKMLIIKETFSKKNKSETKCI